MRPCFAKISAEAGMGRFSRRLGVRSWSFMLLLRNAPFCVWHCLLILFRVLSDFGELPFLLFRSHRALTAENLFLRKQLALFQERQCPDAVQRGCRRRSAPRP